MNEYLKNNQYDMIENVCPKYNRKASIERTHATGISVRNIINLMWMV